MASTVTSTNNLSLRSILEKDKLTGSNFLDWERNLMIVLRHERKWYVLEEPLGEAPPANAPAAARNAHKKHSDDLLDVACLMLATMSPDLQAGLINTNAYDMIRQLRDMFQTQARTERYDATKAFNECKMVKGTSVSDHVMKMKRHLDHLERLGHPVPLQLATNTILNSLSEDYRPFVVNYNMNNMEKTIAELHSMLKTAELNMGNKNKTKDVLMVKDGGVKKKNGQASTRKGKGPVQAIQSAPKKGKSKGKGKKVKPNKARTENRCFICNEIGHWRQNCPKRHEAGRNHSSTQQLRKVAVLHIQELEVSPGGYDQLLNNSYKCCRLKVAQIFDRVASIGRDPRALCLQSGQYRTTVAWAVTDGQSERTIQTLEDMLRACVLDFGGSWDTYLPLAEFSYNNSYHSSIGMPPFEMLYGRRCRTPICWGEVGQRVLGSTEVVQRTTEDIQRIRERLRTAQSRQKSYADRRRSDLEFQVGDRVLLKVSPWKGVIRFRKRGKLGPRYIGPFTVLARVGKVAYRLELPAVLGQIHSTFHVSQLRKCLADETAHIPLDDIQVDESLNYVERPVAVLDRKVKRLRRREIGIVKVQWQHRKGSEWTWEPEAEMREHYPELFSE
ncbi:hypothetical protein OSB04_027460 [Centaurea solstitialis]|uniref:CCHC-type domain-containing protein n=1 Tax=Centaurea solstitialis TaxID=347529 RepID=A0AA38SFC5_9ASTR|nr:hypothetical protein OSB04_027460 [Centaurea solstitialis]